MKPCEARRERIRTRGLLRCGGCALPPELCICSNLPLIEVATRLLVVIHHVELRKSSNTGRLATRILGGSLLRVRGLPHEPTRPPPPEGKRLVIFPDGAGRELTQADRGSLLVVPDGSWSQARRMINRDPDLVGAEVVRLPEGAPSRYGLRRSPRPGTLSTFEAIARALGLLEGVAVEEQMMAVFDDFVRRSRIVRASGKGGFSAPGDETPVRPGG